MIGMNSIDFEENKKSLKRLSDWIRKYDASDFSGSVYESVELGFRSWECKDDDIGKHIPWMLPKLRAISKGKRLNPYSVVVWFRNVRGKSLVGNKTYTEILFNDVDTYELVMRVVPFDVRVNYYGLVTVWGPNDELIIADKWAEVKEFFNSPGPLVVGKNDDRIDSVPPVESTKPKAKVVGEDGNVFNLLCICSRELKKAGLGDKVDDMIHAVTTSGSYETALNKMAEYCELY